MSDTLRLHFANHPDVATKIYLLASEIVDDFEDYGPVIQANDSSEYDESTVIIRLRDLRNEIIAEIRKSRE